MLVYRWSGPLVGPEADYAEKTPGLESIGTVIASPSGSLPYTETLSP